MATDGLSLYACLSELRILVGGKIDKVQQPNKDMVVLHIHTPNSGRVRLLLCIHAENGRIQLVSKSFENPEAAPAFCMLLRKYLIGCRIAAIEQVGMNRIAALSLYGKNEFFDAVSLKLIVELMGRHGNLFLLDETGKILDCMRHFGIGENAARITLPNMPYENPPEVEKLHPFSVTADELLLHANGRPPQTRLTDAVQGVSRLCAEQIVKDGTTDELAAMEIVKTFRALGEGCFAPSLIPSAGVLPFAPKNAAYRSFPTMSDAQDAFYRMRDEAAVLTRERTALRSTLDHAKKRVEKRLGECAKLIGDADRIERDRLYGELLTYAGTEGSAVRTSITVQNYYADPPEPLVIPLDPKFSVAENARRYFKKYQKNKAARQHAIESRDALNDELTYLGGQLLNVAACTAHEELNEIRDELLRLHYLRETEQPQKRAQSAKSRPLHYRTANGTDILVGKNNLQNERLIRTSDPDAIWLHAKGVPASHVVLNAEEPAREDLLLAAEIAAYHSGASASANVPVDYTQVRHVKKPSGARPGFVNYFHQHTVFVTPQYEKLKPYRVEEDV